MTPPGIDEIALPNESVWQTAKRDFATASGLRVLGVLLLLVWMAFQWGLGNDIVMPPLVAAVFDAVDDGETWGSGTASVAAATAVGFGFWSLTQTLDAIVMLNGLRLIPNLTARIAAFLRRKGWVRSYDELSWSMRWIIAYATGASALCLVDLFATGRYGVRGRRHVVLNAVLLSAGSVAIVVALASAAAMVAKRIPATEEAAETFIRFAKNPLTWITIFIIVYLVGRLRGGDADESDSPEPG